MAIIKKLANWRNWLRGLLAAAIGGAANATTLMVVDPLQFNFNTGMSALWKVSLVSAVLNAAFYLKQSPIPPSEEEDDALQPDATFTPSKDKTP